MSIVVKPIQNITVSQNARNDSINLFKQFDDPLTTGLVAQFRLYDSSLGGGVTRVVLFDQRGQGAPLTVKNFRNYVGDGDYKNTIIHRSVPGFVIQGGGFTANNVERAIANNNPPDAISLVPTDAPIQNEFSPQRSNLRGTIAMAKLGNDPDSATSQWFFNLGNNSANLDAQNGGFTVFGKVLSRKDLAPINAIARLPLINASGFFQQGAFGEMPFIDPPRNGSDLTDENFVRYRNITVSREDELQFDVVRNSNPDLVKAQVNNRGRLVLDYGRNQTGRAKITVQATNLFGKSVRDTFRVRVTDRRPRSATDALLGMSLGDRPTTQTSSTAHSQGDSLLEGGQHYTERRTSRVWHKDITLHTRSSLMLENPNGYPNESLSIEWGALANSDRTSYFPPSVAEVNEVLHSDMSNRSLSIHSL